ncbi:hypothetical protein BGZ83_011657, partial [Gryganskiella cystojenkinii]
ITALLTFRDRAICLRVNKRFYGSFIDQIWDTVAIFVDVYPSNRILFQPSKSFRYSDRSEAYKDRDGDNKESYPYMSYETAASIFFRNVHRIRVLTIKSSALDIIVSHRIQSLRPTSSVQDPVGSTTMSPDEGIDSSRGEHGTQARDKDEMNTFQGLPPFRLEALTCYLEGYKTRDAQTLSLLRLVDFLEQQQEPLCPSSAATTATATAGLKRLEIRIWTNNCAWNVEDQTRILIALPSTLEYLTLNYFHDNYSRDTGITPQEAEEDLLKSKLILSGYEFCPSHMTVTEISNMTTSTATYSKKCLPHLNNLKVLSLINLRFETIQGLLWDPLLLSRSPNLEELLVQNNSFRRETYRHVSSCLAELISYKTNINITNNGSDGDNKDSGSATFVPVGWKTLAFACESYCDVGFVDQKVVQAIVNQSPSLENLRMNGCLAFTSASIQDVLASAPNLKRIDIGPCSEVDPDYTIEKHTLLADHILRGMDCQDGQGQGQDEGNDDNKQRRKGSGGWACLGLRSFKCAIGGVPRPDITSRTDGHSLHDKVVYHNKDRYSPQESRNVQEKVLEQLGRLSQLQELTLSFDPVVDISRCFDYCCFAVQGHLTDEEWCAENGWDPNMLQQYACLSLSLDDGLNRLEGLKSLRRFRYEKLSHSVGEKERKWMQENWPEFGQSSRDTFWTERGHAMRPDEDDSDEEDKRTYDYW